MSVNANVVRDRFNKWTEIFGRGYGEAFDAKGWLYYTRDAFDFYAAIYLDTYNGFLGAISMTHETDGGRILRDKKEDGSPLTVELGAAKHFVTALSTVRTASQHRRALLDSFFAYRRKSATGEHAGKLQRIVATSPDPRPLARLKRQLDLAGVESYFSAESFTQADANDFWSGGKSSQTFPAGSLVVDLAQPNGALAKALLEPGQDFEPEFVKRQMAIAEALEKKEPKFGESDYPEFYDLTGWSPIYGHNLQAWWCETAPKIARSDLKGGQPGLRSIPEAKVGWAIEYRDLDDVLAVYRLAEDGVRVRVLTKDMKLGGDTFKRGSFLILKGRNDADIQEKMARSLRDPLIAIWPVDSAFPDVGRDSPGGTGIRMIRKPKIGLVMGDGERITQYGFPKYVLEQVFKLDYVPMTTASLNGNLDEFSCIILPAGVNSFPSALNEWVSDGGCVVTLGAHGFGEGRFAKLEPSTLGEGKTIRNVPGTIFQAELDTRSILSFGYGDGTAGKVPFGIMVDGNRFYKPGTGGNPVVTFPEKDVRLLTGWSWPDNTEKAIAGTVAVWDQEIGNGRAVIFASDPTERAMWPGQYKLLLNAMFIGPGV
jgi:hypothetical protein